MEVLRKKRSPLSIQPLMDANCEQSFAVLPGVRNTAGKKQQIELLPAPCAASKKLRKGSGKHSRTPRESPIATPVLHTPPPRTLGHSTSKGSYKDGTQHRPSQPHSPTFPVGTVGTAEAGGKQTQQAEGPPRGARSSAVGKDVAAGQQDEGKEYSIFSRPCRPPEGAGAWGFEGANLAGETAQPGHASPHPSAGSVGAREHRKKSERRETQQQPGQSGHHLAAAAAGASAESTTRSVAMTTPPEFRWFDELMAANGGEFEEPKTVLEQLNQPRGPHQPESEHEGAGAIDGKERLKAEAARDVAAAAAAEASGSIAAGFRHAVAAETTAGEVDKVVLLLLPLLVSVVDKGSPAGGAEFSSQPRKRGVSRALPLLLLAGLMRVSVLGYSWAMNSNG
ncbi:hypothetical protein EBH_0056860 [Eimeria brunetti]|uniref:Uncharacterized protein n=1 Tax=Eimeria brunetti TaxID=51314 RepID=U6LVZ7_9EIME|nr:hypothetical protein EBH_0056860 [Eimeria brunetti]